MRVPLSWLRRFVPYEGSVEDLAARLSSSGLAVEELIRTGGGLSGVVVGEVRAVREHPNADTLMLVKAFDGTIERDIVCGARNYVVGDRVPLALPGARLPDGMEIAQRKVRGEVSDGMLCSARELQIAEDHSGILLLDPDARLGADLVSELDLDDVILHLDVTTNRPDCLSIVGVAREVAALFRLPMRIPAVSLQPDGEEADVHVDIQDADGCPRYLARVITDVKVARSPWWMRRLIFAAGMRPISNIVDVTNFVLLERGQPLHAFDLDTIGEGSVVVRAPRMGERLTTLDGIERALEPGDVAICDATRPIAVAGVMGGAATEVSEGTTRILLESACFDPQRIRRTAARLKLRSEASIRFERGADVEGVAAAADLAASLFVELGGGRVSRTVVDAYPRPFAPVSVSLRVARANAVIGATQTAEEMSGALQALGCVVAGEDVLSVQPPSWRADLSIEEDLIEEVARLHGLDAVPETLPASAATGGLTRGQQRRRVVRRALLGAGLNEAQTLSLLSPAIVDRFDVDAGAPRPFTVANPLSEEESVLRPSLIPGLVMAAQRNVARRVLPVRLFEAGVAFLPDVDGGLKEVARVAWVLTGPASVGHHAPARPLDFFDGTGVLDALMSALGITSWEVAADGEPGVGHPGRAATVMLDGRRIGSVMELRPALADALEVPGRLVVAELDLDALAAAEVAQRAPEIPRLPAVGRDIALVVPVDVPAAEVLAVIRSAAGALMESVALFDVYQGPPVAQGCVSLAYAMVLRAPDRTLTDADADAIMTSVRSAADARGWIVRD